MTTLFWNPPREAFVIPGIHFAVYWYSILFALGFYIGYVLVKRQFKDNQLSQGALDKLVLYVALGTIIGARLGHVLFYEWSHFKHNLLEILNIRAGGLASHGGALGIFFALWLYYKKVSEVRKKISFLKLLDILSFAVPFVAVMIRCGNFVNQEIVGIPTDLPLGVIFGQPFDGSEAVARHPVQLYEAFAYLETGLLLWVIKKYVPHTAGALFGIMLANVFFYRFFIEFLKVPQESISDGLGLQMGQILSIPPIIVGLYFAIRHISKKDFQIHDNNH